LPANGKISVCFLIFLAISGSIVSIARVPFVHGGRLDHAHATEGSIVTLLSAIETGIGISVISLAALRPLLHNLSDRTKTLLSHGKGSWYGESKTNHDSRHDQA
jgi:hypothetical protein